MKNLLFCVLFVTGIVTAQQMTFETHTGHGLTQVAFGGMIVADVNNDGIDDVFAYGASNQFPHTLHARLSLGNGNGGFGSHTDFFHKNVQHAEFVDWDGDGDMDLVMTYLFEAYPHIAIYLNDGGGVFTELTSFVVDVAWQSYGHVYNFNVADLDNDGHLDIFAIVLSQPGDVQTRIYHNNGDNSFTKVNKNFGSSADNSISFDYDQDGYQDIVVATYEETTLYRNMGNLDFEAVANFVGLGENVSLAVANLDNNAGGYESLLLGGGYSHEDLFLEVYHNNAGTFSHQQSLTGIGVGTIVVADFNNDGWLDVFTGAGPDVSARLYKNINGSLSLARTFPPSVAIEAAIAIDFNSDGKIDLIYSGGNNAGGTDIHAWRNTTAMPVELSTEASPSDWGTTSGDGTFYQGQSVTVEATAHTDYYFAFWQDTDGNILSYDASYSFVIEEDIVVIGVFTDTVSIDDVDTQHVVVYPNPVRDLVQLSLPLGLELDAIVLTDSMGRSYHLPPAQHIDMSRFSSGMYILTLQADGQSFSKKIIKQ